MLTTYPTTLSTPRLHLRLLDPTLDSDCNAIVQIVNEGSDSKSGHERLGVKTVDDSRWKLKRDHVPQELCLNAKVPMSNTFLVYAKEDTEEREGVSVYRSLALMRDHIHRLSQ